MPKANDHAFIDLLFSRKLKEWEVDKIRNAVAHRIEHCHLNNLTEFFYDMNSSLADEKSISYESIRRMIIGDNYYSERKDKSKPYTPQSKTLRIICEYLFEEEALSSKDFVGEDNVVLPLIDFFNPNRHDFSSGIRYGGNYVAEHQNGEGKAAITNINISPKDNGLFFSVHEICFLKTGENEKPGKSAVAHKSVLESRGWGVLTSPENLLLILKSDIDGRGHSFINIGITKINSTLKRAEQMLFANNGNSLVRQWPEIDLANSTTASAGLAEVPTILSCKRDDNFYRIAKTRCAMNDDDNQDNKQNDRRKNPSGSSNRKKWSASQRIGNTKFFRGDATHVGEDVVAKNANENNTPIEISRKSLNWNWDYLIGLSDQEVLHIQGNWLISSALFSSIEDVKKLLAHGAPINYQDDLGNSAMHYAAMNQDNEMVDLLNSKGWAVPCDLLLCNLDNELPSECARGNITVSDPYILFNTLRDLEIAQATAEKIDCQAYFYDYDLIKKSEMSLVKAFAEAENQGVTIYQYLNVPDAVDPSVMGMAAYNKARKVAAQLKLPTLNYIGVPTRDKLRPNPWIEKYGGDVEFIEKLLP